MRANELMDRAARIILDETNVRWPLKELCMWINDAQREIVLQKPSAYARNVVLPLIAGTMQPLPVAYTGILRVVRNINTAPTVVPRVAGRAVRIVAREVLDTQSPDWHMMPAKAEVKHFIYDEQDPKTFYVYPPNTGTGRVEAVLSAVPPAIVASGAVDDLASYAGELPLDDTYFNPALDYVLYRSYMKDAAFAGNGQRAALHYQQFANSLGIKVRLDAALSPNTAAATVAS